METIKLPFDQYQRYRIVSDAVEALRAAKTPFTILEVGGSPGQLLNFLPEDNIILLDEVSSKEQNFIRGDGAALPFADKAFDITISVDVLEHIAPKRREAFISELKRVSKSYVLIAAPFKSRATEEAESLLFDVIKAANNEEHAFLKEHIEYGLPEKTKILERLGAAEWETISVPNGALKRWLPMMALSLYIGGDEFLQSLSPRINSFYNSSYYDDDNMEPSYRHLLLACRGSFSEGVINKIRGLAANKAEVRDLDLSWVTLLITLFGYKDIRKAWDAEKSVFRDMLSERDKHIRSLKDTLKKRDEHIKNLKETVETKDERIEIELQKILDLQNKLNSLEGSLSVKALKSLGLTKAPDRD